MPNGSWRSEASAAQNYDEASWHLPAGPAEARRCCRSAGAGASHAVVTVVLVDRATLVPRERYKIGLTDRFLVAEQGVTHSVV